MARITRPLRGRLQVEVPYRRGAENYILLREICGEGTHVRYNRQLRCFEITRGRLPVLMDRLATELGQPVELVLHGAAQTHCVEACWRDAKPETAWQCVCSCAGWFHGSGQPPPKDLGGGLYVDTEYTTQVYTLMPR